MVWLILVVCVGVLRRPGISLWRGLVVVVQFWRLAGMRCPLSMRIYSAILHELPIISGLTMLSSNGLVSRAFRGVTEPVWAFLKDGTPIKVSVNEYHGRSLYLFGVTDPKVMGTAVALLREGDVFLDIGANYSTIGLAAARVVGESGRVHLFEPQKEMCETVQQAIELGGLRNVVLHRMGLWNKDDTLILSRPEYHSGRATFESVVESEHWSTKETCQLRDVATYVPPLVEGKDFGVKIDIEGAEPRVMPWLLEQPRMRFIIFEAARNQRELYDLVTRQGWFVYGLCRNLMRLRIERVESFEHMANFHDLVAVRVPESLRAPRKIAPGAFGELLRRSTQAGGEV